MNHSKSAWELLGVERHQLPLLLPVGYRDYRQVVTDFSQIANLIGQPVVLKGWCMQQGWSHGPKPRFRVTLYDQQGLDFSLSLFCKAEDTVALPHNEDAAFYGVVMSDYHGRCFLQSTHAIALPLIGRINPVYPALKGRISREGVFELITTQLDACAPDCLDWLRTSIADIPVGKLRSAIECRTWTIDKLVHRAHWPTSIRQGEACIKVLERMAAYIEAHRLCCADRSEKPVVRPLPNGGFQGIPERCPFPLTGEQISVALSILDSFHKPTSSQGLLLGDVGSGKSYVIALVVAAVVRGGGRVAVMLPSRILVNQMHALFVSLFPELIPQLLDDEGKAMNEGPESSLWVGTTGLLHHRWPEPWDLVVVDEQQRFSVQQRQQLDTAHLLEATATPICRTMALARWGSEIDIFRLIQSPVKRIIETKVFTAQHRHTLMSRLMHTLSSGGQVMVICPRKDGPQPGGKKRKGAQDPNEEQASVARVLADFERYLPKMAASLGFMPKLVFATGARTPEENEAALAAMKTRQADMLVATTVVETGVNIPTVTQIVIFHADRLGAVQLHQLRGRLVRAGGHGLFDLYLPTPPSATTLKRMEIMTTHTAGYEVAMADLRLRGCGDLLKGATQAGSGESILPRRAMDIDDIERFVESFSGL